jgi:6-phosphogluconolactonase
MNTRNRLMRSLVGLLLVAGVGGIVAIRCGSKLPNYKYFLYVGNNGETTANIHPHVFDSDSGSVGARGTSQTAGAAVVSVALHSTNRFLYTAGDNSIHGYSLAASDGAMESITGSPVTITGALHVIFSPNGSFLFVTTNSGAPVRAYSFSATTGLPTFVNSDTPAGTSPASLVVHPDSKYLYSINSSGTVSMLNIDSSTGAVSASGAAVSTASTGPRQGAVTPNGKYLYTADSGGSTISGFPLDSSTGAIGTLFSTTVTSGPVSLDVDPTSKYLFVATTNGGSGGKFEAFSIDDTTGALTALTGSPFSSPAAAAPSQVRVEPNGNFVLTSHYRTNGTSQMAVWQLASGVPTITSGSPFDICSNILAMAIARITQ